MNANLLTLAQEAMGGDFSRLAGQFSATRRARPSPHWLAAAGGARQRRAEGATTQGASGLMSLINGANLDVSSLGNIGALQRRWCGKRPAEGGHEQPVPAVFGDKSSALVNALSSASGIKSSSATNLLRWSCH
jgi:hypothetical protein